MYSGRTWPSHRNRTWFHIFRPLYRIYLIDYLITYLFTTFTYIVFVILLPRNSGIVCWWCSHGFCHWPDLRASSWNSANGYPVPVKRMRCWASSPPFWRSSSQYSQRSGLTRTRQRDRFSTGSIGLSETPRTSSLVSDSASLFFFSLSFYSLLHLEHYPPVVSISYGMDTVGLTNVETVTLRNSSFWNSWLEGGGGLFSEDCGPVQKSKPPVTWLDPMTMHSHPIHSTTTPPFVVLLVGNK